MQATMNTKNMRNSSEAPKDMEDFVVVGRTYVPEHLADINAKGNPVIAKHPAQHPLRTTEAMVSKMLYALLGAPAGKTVETSTPRETLDILSVAKNVFTREEGFLLVICGDCDFKVFNKNGTHFAKVHLCHIHSKSVETGNVDEHKSRRFVKHEEAVRITKLLKQAGRVFENGSPVTCVDCSITARHAINNTVGIEFSLCELEIDDLGEMPRANKSRRNKRARQTQKTA